MKHGEEASSTHGCKPGSLRRPKHSSSEKTTIVTTFETRIQHTQPSMTPYTHCLYIPKPSLNQLSNMFHLLFGDRSTMHRSHRCMVDLVAPRDLEIQTAKLSGGAPGISWYVKGIMVFPMQSAQAIVTPSAFSRTFPQSSGYEHDFMSLGLLLRTSCRCDPMACCQHIHHDSCVANNSL